MAERIVDMAEEAPRPQTAPAPDRRAAADRRRCRRPAGIAAHGERLVRLYGAEAALAAGGPAAEARHAVLHEGALTLEDVWVRRTARAWFSPDPLESLQPLADAMVPLLGWSPTDTAAQIAACRAIHEGSLAAIREPVPA
jgi:glycerol-3-phosphate dehydrogenase